MFLASPNPVGDNLRILSSACLNNYFESITLIDMNERVIKRFSDSEMLKEAKELILNFSNISKGVYLLSIQTPEKILTKKVIKI